MAMNLTKNERQCANGVAVDWLSRRPSLEEVRNARDELGPGVFNAAVRAHHRAEEGVLEEQARQRWSGRQLSFDDATGNDR
ncbi:MAG: hypothetical protein AAF467_24640 [Actinomycetota bacterium]